MAGQPSVPFGKRRPAAPSPPRKRSESARLKLMAGAGAAALGVYALAPGSSCPDGRLYRSLGECLSDNRIGEALCKAGFDADAGAGTPAGIVFSGPDWGTTTALVTAPSGGLMTRMGDEVDSDAFCRVGQRSSGGGHSSGGSGGGRRSSWWGGGDGGSSSSSSSSGYHAVSDGGGHSVSRGGFGSFGHGFGGGGGG